MESENYNWIKSLFLGLFLLVIIACNNDNKNMENNNSNTNIAQSASQTKQMAIFDLPDSIISTTVGKSVKMCVPISKNSNNLDFSVSMTKPPVHGKLTPSVSSNILCFDYTPTANYSGSDHFDCKVCFTTSGYCQEKTWDIEIKKDLTVVVPVSKTTFNPTRPLIKKEEPSVKELPSVPSTIFSSDKKNNDGYTPKN